MSEYGSTYKPETGAPRRGLFSRQSEQMATDLPGATMQDRLADNLQRAVDERLEDGLRTIEEQATDLMREIASEVWRTSGADVRPEQERIVSLLSRDQAIKGLIATSDERFQAIALRQASLEDTITDLAETGRATREAMTASAEAIREIANSPTLHGVDLVRSQLEQVELHIAATFQHLEERDRKLTDNVLTQVHEHSDLIARETTRIVEAMQGYVQGGAEAMGQLAQRVEAHAQTFAMRDEHIAERVGEAVGQAVRPVEHLVEARMRGVAELIRSDSEALRRLIEERTSAQETAVLAALDDKMDAFTTIVEAQMGMLSSSTGEQVLMLSSALAGAIDRSFARLGDQMDGKLDRVTETVALRAAEATDLAIASSIGTTLDKMTSAARSVEGVDTMVAESQTIAEERMLEHIDQRVMAVAKLIRSDNQALAEKVAMIDRAPSSGGPDPELLRQTLRAVKELQAGLASDVAVDVAGTMDARFQSVNDQLHKEGQSTAEAMIKVAEVLGEKMDRLTIRVDEGYGNDMQIVIDRMTDAITALSGRTRHE
jgi:hypothetical protein